MELPKVGDRIVVNGINYAKSHVKDVVWIAEEVRWKIVLDWGEHGISHVFACDENKIWYRYTNVN